MLSTEADANADTVDGEPASLQDTGHSSNNQTRSLETLMAPKRSQAVGLLLLGASQSVFALDLLSHLVWALQNGFC